jgi:hypothetical protein
MSNVVVLDTKYYYNVFKENVFASVTDIEDKYNIIEDIYFEAFNGIVILLASFLLENDKWDATVSLGVIAQSHKTDYRIDAIIAFLHALFNELNEVEINASKMFIQTSLIHPFLHSICKICNDVVPHSSNKPDLDTLVHRKGYNI